MKKKKTIKAQTGKYIGELARKSYEQYQDQKEEKRRSQEQEDSYRKRMQEYQAEREVSRMPRQVSPMEESSRMPMDRNPMDEAYYIMKKRYDEQMLSPSSSIQERKKGGMTKGQKKVGKVMSEFKSGKLKSSSGKKVTNPKQAIAIGLSEAGMSKKKMGGGMMNDNSSQYSHGGMNKKKMQDGGMVRGQGAAIRGTKFKGIF